MFRKVIHKKESYEATGLRVARQKKRISLRSLSDLTGLSRSYLSAIELGHQTTSLEVATKIKEAIRSAK